MSAASRALRRAVVDDPGVVARYLITMLTVPGHEPLVVRRRGCGRRGLAVGEKPRAARRGGPAVYPCRPLRVPTALRRSRGDPAVGTWVRRPLCRRIDPTMCVPGPLADTQCAAGTQPQGVAPTEDAGAQVAHPGVQRLLFEELDGGRGWSLGRVKRVAWPADDDAHHARRHHLRGQHLGPVGRAVGRVGARTRLGCAESGAAEGATRERATRLRQLLGVEVCE